MEAILKNIHGELRAGWQIAIFVVVFAVCAAALIVPLAQSGIIDKFTISSASLFSVLVATYIVTRFVNKKPMISVGLSINKHTMRELGIGCLVGWLMMTGIFGTEYMLDYVKVVVAELSFGRGLEAFFLALVFFGVAAMFEEVLFRGYLFQTLVRGISFYPAVALVGLFFGFAHFNNPNANTFGLINTVFVSIVFCVAYWRTRSLWLPFGIHWTWNFSQTTLYGYPTSGHHFSSYELTRLTQFGAEWITGGSYGPEGGALATVAILTCGIYLYYGRSLQPFQGMVTLEREEETLKLNPFTSQKAA